MTTTSFINSTECHSVDTSFCDYQMNKKMDSADVWHVEFVGCACDGQFGPCLLEKVADVQYWCDELSAVSAVLATRKSVGV